MRKWIVAIMVVGFVGMAARAEDKHDTAAPSIDKKDDTKVVVDKSEKLFNFINACMSTPPTAAIDNNTLVK